MTPKAKAKDLVELIIDASRNRHDKLPVSFRQAKKCALICVNEIIVSNPCSEDSDRGGGFAWTDNSYYWQEVKREIEKL